MLDLGPRPSLVIANRVDILEIKTDGKELKHLVSSKQIGMTMAVDIDTNDGYLYWADYKKSSILRAKTSNTSKSELLTWGKLARTAGIAVDWIGKKLYWTSSGTLTNRVK